MRTPVSTLLPGTYTGRITFTPSSPGANPQSVPVTLRVSVAGHLSAVPSQLSFTYQIGGTVPAAQYVRIADPLGRPTQVTASATSVGLWLSVTPSTAVTPANMLVGVNPAGMSPGTYFGTVLVSPAQVPEPTAVAVKLTVVESPQLQINPDSLTWNYQMGAPLPPPQYVYVSSTSSSIPFTAQVIGPPWIMGPATTLNTPAGVPVTIAPPSNTTPGTYTASVMLTPTRAGATPVYVQVTVNLQAPNSLILSQNDVRFTYSAGGTATTHAVAVSTSGDTVQFQASGTTSWITVSQSTSYTPGNVLIGFIPTGLAPGTYSDTVSVFA